MVIPLTWCVLCQACLLAGFVKTTWSCSSGLMAAWGCSLASHSLVFLVCRHLRGVLSKNTLILKIWWGQAEQDEEAKLPLTTTWAFVSEREVSLGGPKEESRGKNCIVAVSLLPHPCPCEATPAHTASSSTGLLWHWILLKMGAGCGSWNLN